MCNFSQGFKLCSCNAGDIKFRYPEMFRRVKNNLAPVPDKRNKNIPLIFIWRLFRHARRHEEIQMMGQYILPVDDLGHGLDSEWIALNLNDRNCFDFEYEPGEGDNIFIQQNVNMGPYISFIYTNNNWIIDHYDPFMFEILHEKDGLIKSVGDNSVHS